MIFRYPTAAALAAGAALTLMAGPAWADCTADLQTFDDQLIAAETGATGSGEMPATEHQEEVLSGTEGAEEEPPMETSTGGDVPATTEHQRQVLDAPELDSEALAGLSEDERVQLNLKVTEARAAARQGDEAGCQAKLDEAREIIAQ